MRTQISSQKPRAAKHNTQPLTGSTTGMYPVVMDDGKTIVFISDRSKETEIRLKYMMQRQHINVK
jgi:hypothetical protein